MFIKKSNNEEKLKKYTQELMKESETVNNIELINNINHNTLLISCENCGGEGRLWFYENKSRELKICNLCNGRGQIVIGEEYCKYKIAHFNRYIPYLWKIIKRKIQLPLNYSYNYTVIDNCISCDGQGVRYNSISDTKEELVTCNSCNGQGTTLNFENCYQQVFQDFIQAKVDKKKYISILNNKEYENEEYQGFSFAQIRSWKWVCVKCINYLDGTDGMGGMNSCSGCVNESMTNANGYSYFKPLNNIAKEWYNRGGYKKNICYDTKHNYKIK